MILAGRKSTFTSETFQARRDWGFSPEYVEGMWRIMQSDLPEDLVIGAGEACLVKEFLVLLFANAGLDVDEHVKIDRKYFRPMDVEAFIADASKARGVLRWNPKLSLRV